MATHIKQTNVQPKATTNFTLIAATASVTKLIDENVKRKELMIVNTSPAILYLHFGNLPSTANYIAALTQGSTFITDNPDRVNGVWASAAGGQANMTEAV